MVNPMRSGNTARLASASCQTKQSQRLPQVVYSELQTTLSRRGHLNPRSNHSPRGEVISPLTKRFFDTLLENTALLLTPSYQNNGPLCLAVLEDIQTLIGFTKNYRKEEKKTADQLKTDLLNAQEQRIIAVQNLNLSENRCRELETTLVGLNQNKSLIKKRCNEYESMIRDLTEKKAYEKEVRSNGLKSFVPFWTNIKALKTRQYKMLIPFYSKIKTITSLWNQTVEKYTLQISLLNSTKSTLKSEINLVLSNINREKKKIESAKKEVDHATSGLSSKEQEIKQFGKDFSKTMDILESLDATLMNCKFLKKSVGNTVKLTKDAGDIDPQQMHALLANIKAIQTEFNKTINYNMLH